MNTRFPRFVTAEQLSSLPKDAYKDFYWHERSCANCGTIASIHIQKGIRVTECKIICTYCGCDINNVTITTVGV